MQYEIIGSAYGGGMGHDGASATATHLSNLHITPIEILESEFPCRITRFDLVPDSGGAGQWRGGLAHAARIRAAGGRHGGPPLRQDRVFRRRVSPAASPAAAARFVVRLGAGRRIRGAGIGPLSRCAAGERFLVQSRRRRRLWRARLRERAAIDRDVAEGYVSASSRKAATAENQG